MEEDAPKPRCWPPPTPPPPPPLKPIPSVPLSESDLTSFPDLSRLSVLEPLRENLPSIPRPSSDESLLSDESLDLSNIQCDHGGLRLDFNDFDSGVQTVCLFAMLSQPNFYLHKQNWSVQMNKPNQSQQNVVSKHQGHPVD